MTRQRLPIGTTAVLAMAFLAGTGSRLPAQDFEGVVTSRARGMPSGAMMRTFFKGVRTRMEVAMPGQGEVAIINDPVAGETYMVIPSQSMYMVMKLSEKEKVADTLVRRANEGSMTPLGTKATVAGHSCEVFRFRSSSGATDICLASGIGAFRSGGSVFSGPAMPGGRQQETPPWMRELLRKGAFPLRVSDTVPGTPIWEVLSLEKKVLEAELFVPPARFRRMEMPAGMRPPLD